jgi:hypothetical protein
MVVKNSGKGVARGVKAGAQHVGAELTLEALLSVLAPAGEHAARRVEGRLEL